MTFEMAARRVAMAGLLLVLAAPAARAVPYDNQPKLLLHVVPTTTSDQCAAGSLSDCRDAVTEATLSARNVGPWYYVYLLAARGDYSNVGGLSMGITYEQGRPTDINNGSGIDIFSWNLCATLEFVTPGPSSWPQPGGGDLLTWDTVSKCQAGETAVAGYFYVAAYGPDELKLIPRPVDGRARLADCCSHEVTLGTAALGSANFSTTGTTPGCNPCDGPCPGTATPAYTAFACTPQPPPPPPPPPRQGVPKILLHVQAVTAKNACAWGALAAPEDAVTAGTLSTAAGPFFYTYLLAAREAVPDLAGLQVGISYQSDQPDAMSDGAGIDIFSWTLCGSMEFAWTGVHPWPTPLSGNLVIWDSANRCQTGLTAVAGWFYMAAYNEDRFVLIPHPGEGLARIAQCNSIEVEVGESELGYASFSEGAVSLGCNPVVRGCAVAVPVRKMTWSGIKTLLD